MTHSRITPKTKERFGNTIKDVIQGLGRKVLVYKQPIKSECSNCHYDKLTDRSTGKCKWTLEEADQMQQAWEIQHPGDIKYKWFRIGRCPVCKGLGYIETKRKVWINCLVTWNPESRSGNNMVYTPAGVEGSTILQLKSDPKNYDTFKNCVSILVDGIECKMSKPPIIRGLGNQTVLVVFAFTTDKPKLDSDEVVKDYS